MKKKKHMVILIFLTTIFVGSFTLYKITLDEKSVNINSDSKKTCYAGSLKKLDKRELSSSIVSACEISCSNEEIINMSKAIVKGKITKLLGEYEYVFTDVDTGEELHSTKYLYDFEVKEILKGTPDKDMKISMPITVEENKFEVGKEYVWCLQRLTNDYKEAYQCVSFLQGLFNINDNILSRNGNSYDEISLDDFKKLIHDSANDSDKNEGSLYKQIINSKAYKAMFEE